MAGLLRGRGGECTAKVALPLLALLQGLDKASIILNRRPLMRMAIITYMVLVHAAVVLV